MTSNVSDTLNSREHPQDGFTVAAVGSALVHVLVLGLMTISAASGVRIHVPAMPPTVDVWGYPAAVPQAPSAGAGRRADVVKPRETHRHGEKVDPRAGTPATSRNASDEGAGDASGGPVSDSVNGGPILVGSPSGDWFLAALQSRIWSVWLAESKPGAQQSVTVEFVIQLDGTVSDLRVVESSGVAMRDWAAQRAISSAAPFPALQHRGPFMRIQAVFRPDS